MKIDKMIKYFNERSENYPLGYNFLEFTEIEYKHKYSSRSDLHNSDRYINGLFYKEISNIYIYNE